MGLSGECAYAMKWCGRGYLRPVFMFDTCMIICNSIRIWHVSGRTRLANQVSCDERKALIIDELHGCAAKDDNSLG